MEWRSKQHPAETLAELGAPAVFAAAAGWCVATISHPAIAAMAAAMAYLAGWIAIRRAGAQDQLLPLKPFELALFEMESDELLLDDPLSQAEPNGRVHQLFAAPEQRPGALVARIADYLGDRLTAGSAGVNNEVADQPIPDASAALHAALANIRASLR